MRTLTSSQFRSNFFLHFLKDVGFFSHKHIFEIIRTGDKTIKAFKNVNKRTRKNGHYIRFTRTRRRTIQTIIIGAADRAPDLKTNVKEINKSKL